MVFDVALALDDRYLVITAMQGRERQVASSTSSIGVARHAGTGRLFTGFADAWIPIDGTAGSSLP